MPDKQFKIIILKMLREVQENTNEQFNNTGRGFPGGAVVENPPASAGNTGSIPGPGRSHMPRTN